MKSIVLCGFMGCGKSTVGKRLAARFDLEFVDMDAYIEQQAGRTIRDIFSEEGEAAFRRMEHEACLTLGQRGDLVIATGGGAVLREDNVAALKQNGVVVWLQVGAACVIDRLQGDTTRPLLQRADKDEAVRSLLSERTPLYTAAADIAVDAESDTEAVADAVAAALQRAEFLPKCPC